jgi:hypothetical protein
MAQQPGGTPIISPGLPHVVGNDDGVGYGVLGTGNNKPNVEGTGVRGTNPQGFYGVYGDAGGIGVYGTATGASGRGVLGTHSSSGRGIEGTSPNGDGVYGGSTTARGVWGDSQSSEGVYGVSGRSHGVHGMNSLGSGSPPQFGTGVWGESDNGFGVYGASKANSGVQGVSAGFDGVHGESQSAQHAGVSGVNGNGGIGVYGASTGNAGQFMGNVLVTGNLTVNGDISLPGADCAEQFDLVGARPEPGTVMVIDREGALRECQQAYDRRVAGVVSGGGEYKPGIILNGRLARGDRAAVALVGKVYCKVDAHYSPVEVGDLLTTSPTTGHAMRADDQQKAFGAIIGKALRPLTGCRGLIPILVALQ